jgi:hypothetical protein
VRRCQAGVWCQGGGACVSGSDRQAWCELVVVRVVTARARMTAATASRRAHLGTTPQTVLTRCVVTSRSVLFLGC